MAKLVCVRGFGSPERRQGWRLSFQRNEWGWKKREVKKISTEVKDLRVFQS